MEKLTRSEIVKFINYYRNYECLWNFKSKYYKRCDLKNKAWNDLAKEFNSTVPEVKRKAKNLRNAYVHEKKKVDSSKKSGSSADIYISNLFYFDEFKFLNNSIVLRSRTSNDPGLEHENTSITVNTTEVNDSDVIELICDVEPIFEEAEEVTESFNVPSKYKKKTINERQKKKKSVEDDLSKYDLAIKDLISSVSTSQTKDDVFTVFAQSIALQLKELPEINYIEAMEEIQGVVSKHRKNVVLEKKKQRGKEIFDDLSNKSIRFGSTSSSSSSINLIRNSAHSLQNSTASTPLSTSVETYSSTEILRDAMINAEYLYSDDDY